LGVQRDDRVGVGQGGADERVSELKVPARVSLSLRRRITGQIDRRSDPQLCGDPRSGIGIHLLQCVANDVGRGRQQGASGLGVVVTESTMTIEYVSSHVLPQQAAQRPELSPRSASNAAEGAQPIQVLIGLQQQGEVRALRIEMAVPGLAAQSLKQVPSVRQQVGFGLPATSGFLAAGAWLHDVRAPEGKTRSRATLARFLVTRARARPEPPNRAHGASSVLLKGFRSGERDALRTVYRMYVEDVPK
jgi:hypothetical protein